MKEKPGSSPELRAKAEHHGLLESIYLNAPLIMVLVDHDRRVRQVNGFATQFAGRSIEETLGLRGGEALRCLHALDDPRGCGFGEFCKTCVIRNTVLDTFETGKANLQVEADYYPQPGDGRAPEMKLLVSSKPLDFKDERMVLVTMLDITERSHHEEHLQTFMRIVSSTSDGIALLDADYRYMFVNEAYERFSGMRHADLIGLTVSEYLGEHVFNEYIKASFDRCLNGETVTYQDWFEYPSLGKRFVEVTYSPYIGATGTISGVVANTRDITERKRVEEALLESDERFRMLIEASPMSVLMLREGRYTYANPAGARLLGYDDPAELKGIKALDTIAPDHHPLIMTRMQRIDTGENNPPVKLKLVRRDGREAISLSTSVSVRINGVPTAIIVGQDITALSATEAALVHSLGELQAIYDAAPVMLCVVDEARRVQYANPAFRTFTGLDEATLRGGVACGVLGCVTARESVGGCGCGERCADCALLHALNDTLRTGAGHNGIERRLTLERAGKRVEVTLLGATAAISGTNGRNALLCLTDITEQRALAVQLSQAQKMVSVGRLAGGVAHDFNNLLMGIMNYTELCRDGIEPDHSIRQWLDEIAHEAERSAGIVRQLLAFSRKQTIAPQVFDLNDGVVNMLKMLRRLIGEDIHLVWQPCAGVWPLKMDPGQIDQVLANLCVNARDAIRGVGIITIETDNVSIGTDQCTEYDDASPGDYVLLAVSDDGCGMDRETLDHVFEPFFTTKQTGEGTGLGLATVYGIVKQNDGFVKVYSEPDRGTSFRICLPRFVGEEDREEADKSPECIGGSETILLVEDEKSIRVTTALFLEQLGYTVLAAEHPDQALHIASEHAESIQLLITDVVMPVMNGRDLAAKLSEEYPRMKCLFISGYTADVIAHRGILEEGVHFLAKPFTRDAMVRKVHEVLKGAPATSKE